MIVVIGGSGFVGSNLVSRLENLGEEVLIIDRLIQIGRVQARKADIKNPTLELPKGCKVVHLAALTNAHESDNQRKEYFEVNVRGTFNVVEACRAAGCKKIVFASSVAAYDPCFKGILTENAPLKPQNFYGTSKIIGETLVRNSGLDHVILRPTNAYGPGGYGVINQFSERLRKKLPLVVWGKGNQERDYLHVEDFVQAIVLSMNKGKGTYNISSGKSLSVNELVKMFKEIANTPIKVTHKEVIEKEIHYTVSHEKARKGLGFVPRANVMEKMRELL